MRPPFMEFACVELLTDLPEKGLEVGASGAVVTIHNDGEAYDVEFMDEHGQTIVVTTVGPELLREAARETDRLREAIRLAEHNLSDWKEANQTLREENHRLRKALEPFACMAERAIKPHQDDLDGCEIVMSVRQMRRARDCFAGKPPVPSHAGRKNE